MLAHTSCTKNAQLPTDCFKRLIKGTESKGWPPKDLKAPKQNHMENPYESKMLYF